MGRSGGVPDPGVPGVPGDPGVPGLPGIPLPGGPAAGVVVGVPGVAPGVAPGRAVVVCVVVPPDPPPDAVVVEGVDAAHTERVIVLWSSVTAAVRARSRP